MDEEIWNPVVGFEDRYEVSSLGRVRSLDNVRPNLLTGGTSLHKGRILKPIDSGNGYMRVYIAGRVVGVHRLVCEAFHGPAPEGKPLVLHGPDDTPSNNRVDNLRWGSYADNEQDKLSRGRNPYASKTHCPQNHPYDEANTRVSKTGYRTCRECSRLKNQAVRDAGLPEGDPRHGTNNGYLGFRCRCEPCKKAGHEYSRLRSLKKSARLGADQATTVEQEH